MALMVGGYSYPNSALEYLVDGTGWSEKGGLPHRGMEWNKLVKMLINMLLVQVVMIRLDIQCSNRNLLYHHGEVNANGHKNLMEVLIQRYVMVVGTAASKQTIHHLHFPLYSPQRGNSFGRMGWFNLDF